LALYVDENDLHLHQPRVTIHLPSSLPITTLDFCSHTVTGLIAGCSQWNSCNQLECVLQKSFFKTNVNIKWTHVGIAMMDWQKAESDIILKQKDRIQQIAVHMNYEITAKDE